MYPSKTLVPVINILVLVQWEWGIEGVRNFRGKKSKTAKLLACIN